MLGEKSRKVPTAGIALSSVNSSIWSGEFMFGKSLKKVSHFNLSIDIVIKTYACSTLQKLFLSFLLSLVISGIVNIKNTISLYFTLCFTFAQELHNRINLLSLFCGGFFLFGFLLFKTGSHYVTM